MAPATIDEYLAGVPDDKRAALEQLRAQIHAAAPDASRGDQLRHARLQARRSLVRGLLRGKGALLLLRRPGTRGSPRRRARRLPAAGAERSTTRLISPSQRSSWPGWSRCASRSSARAEVAAHATVAIATILCDDGGTTSREKDPCPPSPSKTSPSCRASPSRTRPSPGSAPSAASPTPRVASRARASPCAGPSPAWISRTWTRSSTWTRWARWSTPPASPRERPGTRIAASRPSRT